MGTRMIVDLLISFCYELFSSKRASDVKQAQNNFSLFVFPQRHPLNLSFRSGFFKFPAVNTSAHCDVNKLETKEYTIGKLAGGKVLSLLALSALPLPQSNN